MPTDPLSATLFALADPTRRGILARLATGEASVTELAEPYSMSVAAVSKHIKVLEGAGLVSRSKEAQWRPCHLETRPLEAVSQWLEDYRRFWERSADALEEYLKVIQKPSRHAGAPAPPKRASRLKSASRPKSTSRPKSASRPRTRKDRR